MLYVYFGNSALTVRRKAIDFLESIRGDGREIVHIDHRAEVRNMITDSAGGVSLFGTKQIIVLDMLSEDSDSFESMFECLQMMQDSSNDFLIIEGALTAPYKKMCLQCKASVEEVVGETVEKFNTFALTDAFMRKDRKTLWLLLMEAWKAGVTNEAIIGVLLWQVKILRLVQKTKSAEEAEQKAFVYGKAKKALGNFREGELENISRTLLTIYHDGHQGNVDIPLALEEWVLTLKV